MHVRYCGGCAALGSYCAATARLASEPPPAGREAAPRRAAPLSTACLAVPCSWLSTASLRVDVDS